MHLNYLIALLLICHTDIHVLNRRRGCEVEDSSDGTFTFVRGVDEYGYDGMDFLSFNLSTENWVAHVAEATQMKNEWHTISYKYNKGYLEVECVDQLTKLLRYAKEELDQYCMYRLVN